jgi:hypothetical protein
MRDASTLEGGLRRFMGDAVAWLDTAEDELLILEEDLSAEYSNSGGPAENELRLKNVLEALEHIFEGAKTHHLPGLTRLSGLGVQCARGVMREGALDMNLERLTALLLSIDGLRDVVEGLERDGADAPAPKEALDAITDALK